MHILGKTLAEHFGGSAHWYSVGVLLLQLLGNVIWQLVAAKPVQLSTTHVPATRFIVSASHCSASKVKSCE